MSQRVDIIYNAVDRMSRKVEKMAKASQAFEDVIERSLDAGSRFNQMANKDLVRTYKAVTDEVKKADKAVTDSIATSKREVTGLYKKLEALEKSTTVRKKDIKAVEDAIIKGEKGIRVHEKERDILRAKTKVIDQNYEAAKRLNYIQDNLAEGLEKLNPALARSKRNHEDLTEAIVAHIAEGRELEKLTGKDLVDAQTRYSRSTDEARSSLEKHRRELIDLGKSYRKIERNLDPQMRNYDELRSLLDAVAVSMAEKQTRVVKLSTALRDNQKEVDGYTGSVDKAERSSRRLFARFQDFINGRGEIRSAFRDVMDFSFFRSGAVMGLNFFETMRKILAITPMVGVVLGGLTQVVGALGAGLFAAAGSAGRLVGVLGLLPGLYGAIGAGFLGFQSVIGNFVDPSVSGAEQLEGLSKQISAAQDRVSEAKKKASESTELVETGLRTATQAKFGMRQDLSEKTGGGADDVESAQSSLTDLMEKQQEILEGMPPRYKEIAQLVEDIKEDWRDLWITGDVGKSISNSIVRSLTAVKELLASNEVKAGVRAYAALIGYASLLIEEVLGNPAFRMGALQVLRGAIANFRTILDIVKELGPYIGEIAKAINSATGDTLLQILEAIQGSERSAESLGESVYNFIMRGVESFKAWWTALGNVISAFRIIAGKGSIIEDFEGGLVSVTQRFEDWAKKVDSSKVQAFFEGSTKILKGLGRVLLSVGKAMGIVLGGEGDQGAVDSTVAFFDQLAGGIEKLGYWMNDALVTMGPKMVDFFSAIGGALDGEGGKLIDYMSMIVGAGTEFVKFMDEITPPGTIAAIVALSAGMTGLGFAFGQLLVPLARFVGVAGAPFRMLANLGGKDMVDYAPMWAKMSHGLTKVGKSLRLVGRFAGPIGFVIMAVVGAFMALRENLYGITDEIKETGRWIKDSLTDSFGDLHDAMQGEGFQTFMGFVGDVAKNLGWIFLKIGQIAAIIATLTLSVFARAIEYIVEQWNVVWDTIENIKNGGGWSALADGFWELINNMGGFVIDVFEMAWDAVKQMAKGAFQNTYNYLVETFGGEAVADFLGVTEDEAARRLDQALDESDTARRRVIMDVEAVANQINSVEELNEKFGAGGATVAQAMGGIDARYVNDARRVIRERTQELQDSGRLTASQGTAEEVAAIPQSEQFDEANAAGQFPGYVGTEKKGAKITWDMSTVRSFVATLRDPLKKEIALLKNTTMATIAYLRDAPKNNLSRIQTAWAEIGNTIGTTIKTALQNMIDQVNEVLEALGEEPLGMLGSLRQVTSSASSGGSSSSGGGGVVEGDSTFGTGISGMVSNGTLNNQHMLSELQDSLEPNARALLNHIPGVKTLSSVLRPGATTSSGNISQHASGSAIDFVMPSTSQMAQAGAWIRANAAQFGVNPSQVFYPGRGASTPDDHNDHVHVGFGGGGLNLEGLTTMGVTDPGRLGAGALGTIATALAHVAHGALNDLVGLSYGSQAGSNVAAAPSDIMEMIGFAAEAYGANAAGLQRVAFAESGYDPNITNDWDINAQNGTPSRGLFQFIESTFATMAPQARDANPPAWSGVSMNWMDPMAQALTAAWAFTHGQGSHWATAHHYGDGGHFRVNRPTPIVVGDKQPEEVRVTPTRGPNKGKYAPGGGSTVINSSVNVGTLVADDEGIAQLAEKIGMQFAKDLKTARNFTNMPKD